MEEDSSTKPESVKPPPVGDEEKLRAHVIPAVWCNRMIATGFPEARIVRIAFGEGAGSVETVTFRAAVMMTTDDAIGCAESILRAAGVQFEKRVEPLPVKDKTDG